MTLKGLGVAVITPFKKNYDVDFNALENILNFLITGGADYLVVLGTTGESATLSKDEKLEVINTCKIVNNSRIPIVLGIGGNNTFQIVKELETTDFGGITAILSVSPYYNKPNQNGIYRHYEMISNASPLPVILYNVPGRTSSNMLPSTSLRLANDFENIIGIKEASGDLDQIMQIIDNKPSDFLVISGDDILTLPLLSVGIDGVISVIGNAFPKEFSEIFTVFNSNPNRAKEIHYELADFIRLVFSEGSPAGIKALLNLMGLCETTVRPPLYEMSEEGTSKLKVLLQRSR